MQNRTPDIESLLCHNCGPPIPFGAHQCVYCGTSFIIPARERFVISTPQGRLLLRCPTCFTIVPLGPVCQSCGSILPYSTRCLNCGHTVPLAKNCSSCGAHLTEVVESGAGGVRNVNRFVLEIEAIAQRRLGEIGYPVQVHFQQRVDGTLEILAGEKAYQGADQITDSVLRRQISLAVEEWQSRAR